jgi:hypothetical protein
MAGITMKLTPKYRFEILLPLFDNTGKPIAPEKIAMAIGEVQETYGACRLQPSAPTLGWWTDATSAQAEKYEDWTIMLTVDADRTEEHLAWLSGFQSRQEEALEQIEIYVAVTEIFWLAREE